MVNKKKSALAENVESPPAKLRKIPAPSPSKLASEGVGAEELLALWESEVKSTIDQSFESIDEAFEVIIEKVLLKLKESIPEFSDPKVLSRCRDTLSELVEIDESLREEVKAIFKIN